MGYPDFSVRKSVFRDVSGFKDVQTVTSPFLGNLWFLTNKFFIVSGYVMIEKVTISPGITDLLSLETDGNDYPQVSLGNLLDISMGLGFSGFNMVSWDQNDKIILKFENLIEVKTELQLNINFNAIGDIKFTTMFMYGVY